MFKRALKNQLSSLQQSSRLDQTLLQSLQQHTLYAEYDVHARLLSISEVFAQKLGQTQEQLIGRKHQQLCHIDAPAGPDNRLLWQAVAQGKSQQLKADYGRGTSQLWLDSTFIPVSDQGEVIKVIQLATDVTEQHLQSAQQNGVVDALNRSMAVIEFTPEGEVLHANSNFLNAVGYRLEEITGRHHEMFCTAEFYQNYPDFWRELAAGAFKSGRFERRTAAGQVLWLEATYNPVFDTSGRVYKVVKFASDITAQVQHNETIADAARVAKVSATSTLNTSVEGSHILDTALENSTAINQQVEDTVKLISQLNEQSGQIKAIVSTISAIAEQTNLLALNAAIEAARAGDLGRGFAVVADEVRQLAARTSQSTTEIEQVVKHNQQLTQAITTQIESVSQSVQSGSELNQKVAKAIEQIHQGAQKVSQTVAGLALEEQR
ncbi:methyl-accepting chemotaxis protein [Gilvimarinus chinensis]|uniref:methyl-accepting chemotaxis protein n=1 Tax=Gilvimarinus chinensis TaxID=396005 RepID=UPI00037F9D9E|nr:PAS domain-containing methyl-accepting chemotaxis protein [Gilvimarinus chinensis]